MRTREALALLAGVFCWDARADDLDDLELGEVETPWVVGAAHHAQSLEEAPAAVTVITAEEIRRNGWLTITQALSHVRGLYVSDDRNYSYLGVRGFTRGGDYNTRVLVLVNNHPMSDQTYYGSLLGREFGVDLDLVERIEIIRGPSSSLYGSNALLAVINVVTRATPDAGNLEGTGLRASISAESLGYTKGQVGFDRLLGDAHVLFSASYEHGYGQEFEYEELGLTAPTARDSDRMQELNLFGTVTWTALKLQAGLNRYRKYVPTAPFASVPERGTRTTDYRAFAEAKLQLEPVEKLEFMARASVDWARYFGLYSYFDAEGGNFSDSSEDTTATAELRLSHRPQPWLRATAGAVGSRVFDIGLVSEQPAAGVDVRVDLAFFTAGLYGDVEVNLMPQLTLIAGARHDIYESFGDRTSPRVSLLINPIPGSTLKLIYGEAFRAPNPFELYYQGGTNTPNPALEPEMLQHYELVLEQDLGGRGLLTFGLFHYDIFGLIAAMPVPNSDRERYENINHALAGGMEVEVSGRLPWLSINGAASYAYSKAIDSATRQRLANSPEHLVQLRASFPVYRDRIFIASALRFIGDRPGLPGRAPSDAAFTCDLTVTWDEIMPGLDGALGATNLFDRRWTIPGSVEHAIDRIEQDGRSAWIKLSYLF